MKDRIQTDNAPRAIGPYSQAIKANGFVFASGQIALDPATMEIIEGGVREQTERVLQNLTAVLEASGSVTLATVRAIAETGVDFISVGALTHSARAVDIGLDFEE